MKYPFSLKCSIPKFLAAMSLFSLFTCNSNPNGPGKFGSLKITIMTDSAIVQRSSFASMNSGKPGISKATVTVEGMDPVDIIVSGSSGSTQIDDIPIGNKNVSVDLKNSSGTTLYTETQSVTIKANEVATPQFDSFKPVNESITVLSPDGNETFDTGSTEVITWNGSHEKRDVKIELYKSSSFYSSIANSTDNSGSYNWNVSTGYEGSNNYKIKISSVSDPSVYDFSSSDFSLVSPLPLIFQESFSSLILWYTTNPYGLFEIVSGKLRISSGGDLDYAHYAYSYISDVSAYYTVETPFKFSADVEHLSGSTSHPYGIGFYSTNLSAKVYFMVNADGSYELAKYDDLVGWSNIIAWTENSKIGSGDGELKMSYASPNLDLYYNNEHIDSAVFPNLNILYIILYQQDDPVVEFDNVKVYGTGSSLNSIAGSRLNRNEKQMEKQTGQNQDLP
jgi:hypothetical protein